MKAPPQNYLSLLARYLLPRWKTLLLLLLLLLMSISVQLGMPRIIGLFIDQALGDGTSDDLINLALLYLGLAGTSQLLTLGSSYISQNLAWQATNTLREDLFDHCLRLGLPFHQRRTPGELIQRIDGDVGALSGFLSQFSVQLLSNMLLLFGVLTLLFQEDWRVGLALSSFVVIMFLVFRVTRHMAVPAFTQEREVLAQLTGYVEERLGGLADIRPNGAAQYVMQGLYLLGRERFTTAVSAWIMSVLRWASIMSTFLTGDLLALGTSAWLFLEGKISIGTVYLIYSYTLMLLRPLDQIATQLQDFQKAGAGAKRVLELLHLPSESDELTTASLPSGALGVELQSLTFRYDAEGPPALQQVSLRLKPGRVLGVIGRTGSGKSTLARLLVHFYPPSDGNILIGDQEIRKVSSAELRSKVVLVTQEVQLFHASIRDNVTMFALNIPDAQIVQALEEVGMGTWLKSQPQGLDTHLGPAGGGLSAGQAQLLAFARVLLKDPGLIVLDEASSRLDPATEHLLDGAMSRLLAGRTAIIIAHRLSTLARTDEILMLESGHVVESGSRDQLASDPASRFSRLLRVGMEELLA